MRALILFSVLVFRSAAAQLTPPPYYWQLCIASNTSCMAARADTRVLNPTRSFTYPRLVVMKGGILANVSGCLDLTNASMVADLSCSYIWRNAAYHRLVNCAVPLSPLIAYALETARRDSNVVILLPENLSSLFDGIFKAGQARVVRLRRGMAAAQCFVVSAGAHILNENESLNAHAGGKKGFTLTAAAEYLRTASAAAGVTSPGAARRNALLIVRSPSVNRSFCDLPALTRALERILREAEPPFSLQIYHGNESIYDTISAFKEAKLVIGYHGAGFSNAVFSRDGTVLVEWALFDSLLSNGSGGGGFHAPVAYRNNIDSLCALLPKLICLPIGLSAEMSLEPVEVQILSALIVHSNTSFGVLDVRHPANAFLHSARCISIEAGVLENSLRSAVRVADYVRGAELGR